MRRRRRRRPIVYVCICIYVFIYRGTAIRVSVVGNRIIYPTRIPYVTRTIETSGNKDTWSTLFFFFFFPIYFIPDNIMRIGESPFPFGSSETSFVVTHDNRYIIILIIYYIVRVKRKGHPVTRSIQIRARAHIYIYTCITRVLLYILLSYYSLRPKFYVDASEHTCMYTHIVSFDFHAMHVARIIGMFTFENRNAVVCRLRFIPK